MRGRELDVPEICTRIHDRDGVEKPLRLLVDLRDDPYTRSLPTVAVSLATQGYLLARKEFFGQPNNRTVAAHQERFRGLLDLEPAVACPRSFHGHTKAHTVALPKSFRAHSLVSLEDSYKGSVPRGL